MRRFVRVELGDYVVPDEATFCSTLETPTVDIFAMELLVAAKLECWHVAGFNQAINGAPMYLQIHRGGRLPSKWGQHTRAELATMASLLPRFFSTLGSLTLDHFPQIRISSKGHGGQCSRRACWPTSIASGGKAERQKWLARAAVLSRFSRGR